MSNPQVHYNRMKYKNCIGYTLQVKWNALCLEALSTYLKLVKLICFFITGKNMAKPL